MNRTKEWSEKAVNETSAKTFIVLNWKRTAGKVKQNIHIDRCKINCANKIISIGLVWFFAADLCSPSNFYYSHRLNFLNNQCFCFFRVRMHYLRIINWLIINICRNCTLCQFDRTSAFLTCFVIQNSKKRITSNMIYLCRNWSAIADNLNELRRRQMRHQRWRRWRCTKKGKNCKKKTELARHYNVGSLSLFQVHVIHVYMYKICVEVSRDMEHITHTFTVVLVVVVVVICSCDNNSKDSGCFYCYLQKQQRKNHMQY